MLEVTAHRLTEPLYASYVAFINAVRDDSVVDDLSSFRHKLETKWTDPGFIVVAHELGATRIIADLRYVCPAANEFDPQATLYYLAEVRCLPDVPMTADLLRCIINECVRGANQAEQVHFIARVDRERLTAAYGEALLDCGFSPVGERVEFRTRISEMTLVQNDTLRWRNGSVVPIEEAYQVYAGSNANESAALRFDLREHFLQLVDRSGVRSNPDLLQVGYVADRPAAIILLSLDLANGGWCTMLFVGIVPEHQGKGLGRIVHSHGIRVLTANGGLVYHDGTESKNTAMVKVFERQGCRELSRMVEYEYRRSPVACGAPPES